MTNPNESLPITPSVVTWARARGGYSIDDAARYFPRIGEWERGTGSPTYKQLEGMAERFQIPVAVFFFPSPPKLEPTEQSFRTIAAEYFARIPRTVKAIVRKGQAMQLNLAELNDRRNPAARLITRDLAIVDTRSLRTLPARVRNYLGISVDAQQAWATAEEALDHWRSAFAQAGVFVFKDAFRAEGYFGFCVYDKEFPIVYVNNSSSKTRQIFTLFHELAHLLFHTSGVDVLDESYIRELPARERRVEIACNQFAAAFLAPDELVDQLLAGQSATRETATRIAERLNVSRELIYRKMLDRGLVSSDEYRDAADSWTRQSRRGEGGGNYYFTQIAYLGPQYIDLALKRYTQRRFESAQLAAYLNIKPRNLEAFGYAYAGRK